MAKFDDGYNCAVKYLRDVLSGRIQPPPPGGGGGDNKNDRRKMIDDPNDPQNKDGKGGKDGKPSISDMKVPELKPMDKKEAEKNRKIVKNGVSDKTRKEANDSNSTSGGFIGQDAGVEIAKAAGYDESYQDKHSVSDLEKEWERTAIEACSKNNNPGLGSAVMDIKKLYMTNIDWKGILKKFIGRALNDRETDQTWGKKKWLAMDELHKKEKPKNNALSDVVFMIDCSGSISDDLLERLLSECFTIVQKKGIEGVTYAYYDDGIRQVDTNVKLKTAGVLPSSVVNKLKTNKKLPAGEVHGRGGNNEAQAMQDLIQMLGRNVKK